MGNGKREPIEFGFVKTCKLEVLARKIARLIKMMRNNNIELKLQYVPKQDKMGEVNIRLELHSGLC